MMLILFVLAHLIYQISILLADRVIPLIIILFRNQVYYNSIIFLFKHT